MRTDNGGVSGEKRKVKNMFNRKQRVYPCVHRNRFYLITINDDKRFAAGSFIIQ